MANRIVDLLITYRIVKLISTPWEQQEAFKFGIIDKNGNVLRKSSKLNTEAERDSYTILHRFIFNLKRILQKVGMGSSLSSFAVALAFILKEDKELVKHKSLIESTIVSYLKQIDVYDKLLNEVRVIKENKEEPFITCFGIDVYEKDGELISEYENV